jgi:polyisoprenoid-binding protein YceI
MRPLRFAVLPVIGFVLLTMASSVHAEATTDIKNTPSGVYEIDPNHASVTFKIMHMGFSRYTGRFDKLEGTLNFNNASPEQSSLDVTVYPNSVDTNNAKLEEELRGDKWLNVIKYPRATFHLTKIERTGPTTGKVTGELTLMGMTHSLVLDATLIGTGDNFFTKKPVLGISAVGTLKRSDFGFNNMIPMVGDDVTLEIEAEFDKTE